MSDVKQPSGLPGAGSSSILKPGEVVVDAVFLDETVKLITPSRMGSAVIRVWEKLSPEVKTMLIRAAFEQMSLDLTR
jgi:hypothetical protein